MPWSLRIGEYPSASSGRQRPRLSFAVPSRDVPFHEMRRHVLLLALTLVAGAPVFAADPTCTALVATLPASLGAALEVEVAVAVEQGGREVAYERSLVRRAADGTTSTTVLERRGLRRPDGAGDGDGGGAGGDAFELPCEDHDLDVESGVAHLTLRDPDPDAPVAVWSLRFEQIDGSWRPSELIAPFEVRLLFVPVRGRFVTTFDAWRF